MKLRILAQTLSSESLNKITLSALNHKSNNALNMHLVILTICFTVTTASKRHVANSIEPFCEEPPVYDVSKWVNKLHLQRCVIVEIGQEHCAVDTVFGNFIF